MSILCMLYSKVVSYTGTHRIHYRARPEADDQYFGPLRKWPSLYEKCNIMLEMFL